MVEQFAGEQPFQYLAGAEGIPFPDGLPTAVIDVGTIEQERRQLKCREQERHDSDDGHASDANSARHVGIDAAIRNHRQQTHGERTHVSVDQMGEEGEAQERAGERQALTAADGGKRQS